MSADQDLYKILDCSPSSSLDELRQAYHKKILKSHPDKSKSSSQNDKFQKINEAWKILGNPVLKREYDAKIRQAEIDSEKELIYAQLSLSDLQVTKEDKDVYSYPCRCGNNYLIHKDDIQEKDCIIQVPCENCTFMIAIET